MWAEKWEWLKRRAPFIEMSQMKLIIVSEKVIIIPKCAFTVRTLQWDDWKKPLESV